MLYNLFVASVCMTTSGQGTFPCKEHAKKSSHGDGPKPGQELWRRIFQVIVHIWQPQKQVWKYNRKTHIHTKVRIFFLVLTLWLTLFTQETERRGGSFHTQADQLISDFGRVRYLPAYATDSPSSVWYSLTLPVFIDETASCQEQRQQSKVQLQHPNTSTNGLQT